MPRNWVAAPSAEACAAPTPSSQPSGASCTIHLPEDWNRTGGFVNKPVRGWLHSDQQIADTGICYGVRYIGCLEVNTSMKSLDFDTRSLVAKECINKVCEAAGLKTADKKKKIDKRLGKMLAEKPNMDFAGSNVSLTITSSNLNLIAMESGEVIANHEMPNISFASGGDADTLDFVSYVAKDNRYGRACFVLECGGGLAQDVITTIGQAFELRYKQFLKRTPSVTSETENSQISTHNGNIVPMREDPEYYNDLPGKVPPDVADTEILDNSARNGCQNDNSAIAKKEKNQNPLALPVAYATTPIQKDFPKSLIDLAADMSNVSIYRRPEPEYVNTTAVIFNERCSDLSLSNNKITKHDIFDMQPFSSSLSNMQPEETSTSQPAVAPNFHPIGSSLLTNSNVNMNLTSAMEKLRASLSVEPWFHGPISRKESETLVAKDGDFLVRESQGSPGQYVLTGMQSGQRKHLLLVDPEGVIRTKDQVFESVSHLIRYHRDNCLPIISAESALLLRTPVCKLRPVGKSIQV